MTRKSRNANVSGMARTTFTPRPGSLSMEMRPRSAFMVVLSTSKPTPRPDRLVTVSAVENPG